AYRMAIGGDDVPHYTIRASLQPSHSADHGIDVVRIAGHMQLIDMAVAGDDSDVRQRGLDLLAEQQPNARWTRRDDTLGGRLRGDEHGVGVQHTARGMHECRDENGNRQRAMRAASQSPSFALTTSVRCGKGWKRKYFRLSRLSMPAATDQRAFTR